MVRVFQSRFHTETQSGNCLAACVASLLHLDIDQVPYPTILERDNFSRYLIRLCVYLATIGWTIVEWPVNSDQPWVGDACAELLWIAGGPSSRGIAWHSVVMSGANLAHDPHPNGEGLTTVEVMTLLVPLVQKNSLTTVNT